MAIVKIKFNKDAASTLAYVFNERDSTDPVDSENCSPSKDAAIDEFASIRALHNFKEGNQAVHVVQSWGPDESKKLTKQQVNEMGMQLAERYFAGHQFVVVTHSNTDKLHNHIIVNTLNVETGKRINNKKEHLRNLRNISDEICQSRGLSVIHADQQKRRERMPEKVQSIERRNGQSYILDTRQKADLARAYATNYDQYGAIMQALGVAIRVEKTNIAYHYPGQSRPKRGDRLGALYDKAGLESAFKANDQKFAAQPDFWRKLRGKDAQDVLANIASAKTKDYSAFTPVQRGQEWHQHPSATTLKSSPFPIEEIYRARQASIPEYCKKYNIGLETNAKGQTVLKGRPYVEVNETSWKNTRNRTEGSLIDIVSAHKNLTFLQSIAHINGNSQLTELETHFGKVPRKTQSFYIPREKGQDWKKSVDTATRFFRSIGADPRSASKLIGSGKMRVTEQGRIRFETDGEHKGFSEYQEDDSGTWTRTKKRNVTQSFHSVKGTSSKLTLFSSPQSYIKSSGKHALQKPAHRHDVLVLFEPNTEAIDKHLKENPHIKKIEFAPQSATRPTRSELDFFGVLKARYGAHGFEVGVVDPGRERSKGDLSPSL